MIRPNYPNDKFGTRILVFTIFSIGFLMLATWTLGGVYLAIGLTAFVLRSQCRLLGRAAESGSTRVATVE